MNHSNLAHIKSSKFSEQSEETSMNITLREAIIQRVTDKNDDELTGIIEDSVGGAEQVLPGLGVLFEIIWQHSEKSAQSQMVTALKEHLA
jgi:small acid-soluble spore protein I (minor)